jgi:hypothetical protein
VTSGIGSWGRETAPGRAEAPASSRVSMTLQAVLRRSIWAIRRLPLQGLPVSAYRDVAHQGASESAGRTEST